MTHVAVLFTFCPPCPPERTKVSSKSASFTPREAIRSANWPSFCKLTGNELMAQPNCSGSRQQDIRSSMLPLSWPEQVPLRNSDFGFLSDFVIRHSSFLTV